MKKKLLIIVISIVVVIIGIFLWNKVNIGMRDELKEEERALFSNVEELNKSISQHQFRFVDRKIQEIEIVGVEISDDTMMNMEISNSKIKKARFDKVKIKNVDFTKVDLSNSEIRNSIFEKCTFKNVKFVSTDITNTKFSDCRFEESRFENENITQGNFERVKFNDVRFVDTTTDRLSIKESNMNAVEFIRGLVGDLVLEKDIMEQVVIDYKRAKSINISESTITKSEIYTKEVGDEVSFKNCNGKGYSINGVKVPKIVISQCEDIKYLSLKKVESEDVSIDCKRIHGLDFTESKIQNVTLQNSNIYIFTIEDAGSFERGIFNNTIFAAFGVLRSTVKNLRIENSAINENLVLKKAVFENLIMKNVTVSPTVEYIEEDTQYINSMKFPVKK